MTHWTDKLIALGDTGQRPCSDAVEWALDYDSLEAAWAACLRGDWLLWLAGRLAAPPWSDSRRPLVRAAALCAETALPYVRDEWAAGVALSTVQTCVAWSYGEAADKDVREARIVAYAAAAAAVAAAAAASAAAAARTRVLAQCADIVRATLACPALP